MGVEGVLLDAQFVALAFHHIDRVMEHSLDEEIAQFAHQHVRFGEVAQRDGKGADMIMMAMGDGDGVELLVLHQIIQRQTGTTLALGMGPRIQQEPVAFDVRKPSGRADVTIGIEVGDSHPGSLIRIYAGCWIWIFLTRRLRLALRLFFSTSCLLPGATLLIEPAACLVETFANLVEHLV